MKTALLFAGQGSQVVGMGRDLCELSEEARQTFARANEVLGRDLRQVCFAGPEPLLTQTDNAQPGIFVTSLACLAALRERVPGLEYQATAGLSLGEFTALTAAGVLGFEDALRTVQARGRFMQQACDATNGGMASVMGMEEAPLAEVCREADVDLANLNSPGQIVISGTKDKIGKAVELAKARGAKRAIPLQVAGAYHSRLMADAQAKLAAELAGVVLQPATKVVVHNVTARPAGNPSEIKDLLIRQVTSSVRWSDSIQWLIAQGFTRFIELGPGNVLSGLMRRIDSSVTMLNVSDGASLEAAVAKLS
jgi:[acyl-carrier-protein] S-malonyltransferase